MRRARRISLGRTTAAALLGVGLSLGPGHPVQAQSSYEYLQAFSSVLNHIRINYVDSVAYPELVRAAIEGTLRALDPHSYFVSRSDQARLSALERGELAVTGMTVEDGDSAIVVLSVHWESPAAKAGIQPGDRIVAINDTTVRGLRSIDVQLRLAGREGSKVEVLLERGSRSGTRYPSGNHQTTVSGGTLGDASVIGGHGHRICTPVTVRRRCGR